MPKEVQFRVHLNVPHPIMTVQDLLTSFNCEIRGDNFSSKILIESSSYDELRLFIDEIIVILSVL